jgi:hypothetical protein
MNKQLENDMNPDYMPSVMKSNSQRKREAAEYHNHLVEQHGHQSVAGRVVEPAGVSQRNALAATRDATSGTQNRTRGGRRMRTELRSGLILSCVGATRFVACLRGQESISICNRYTCLRAGRIGV